MTRARVLAVGDVGCLLAFALIGLASHDRGVTVSGLARDWLPIALGYACAALTLHAWSRPTAGRWLAAWVTGVTAGVVLRAVLLGREPGVDQLQFLGVTLSVTLVLLGLWRATEAAVHRRRPAL